MARPRWVLHLQAQVWRYLMSIGMLLHRMAPPRPPKHSFVRTIKSTVSNKPGTFELHFYTPKDYDHSRRLGFKRIRDGRGYPVVINFHGGGFTLGTARDDSRWIGTVVDECHAVVVSVDYRRAPEHPFPTAVEDGVDAVIWVAEHAEELGIDTDKIALSGFSSGGNMAFTVPLRLYDHMTGYARPGSRNASQENLGGTSAHHGSISIDPPTTPGGTASSSSTAIDSSGSASYKLQVPHNDRKTAMSSTNAQPTISLCAIVPWYPSIDYTRTREQRRSTTVRKDQDLPALFTDLFDESYLHPPDTVPLDSPYLSPGIASNEHLRVALPQNIVMFTCEWDMLLAEGKEFHQRLISDEVGKNVVYKMIEGVPHGFDKAPNPLKPTPGVKEHYLKACKELRRVFGDDVSDFGLETRRRDSRPVVR